MKRIEQISNISLGRRPNGTISFVVSLASRIFIGRFRFRLERLFFIFVLLCSLLQLDSIVRAQPYAQIAQNEPSPQQRSRVFEAVDGMQVEEVSGATLLLAAYAFFWLLLFAYIVRLARIQNRTRTDLDRLERLLEKIKKSDHYEDKAEP